MSVYWPYAISYAVTASQGRSSVRVVFNSYVGWFDFLGMMH